MTVRITVVLLAAALVGCSNPPLNSTDGPLPQGADGTTNTKQDGGGATDAAKAAATPVPVQVVDKAGYDALLAKHAGKVIVVDFWATWCEPCKERFPHMVKLAAQFPPEDVLFLSVSLDEASDQEKVERMLGQFNASIMTNLLSELDPTTAFEEYDIRAGIPNYKLYDRNGKLTHEFALQADAKLNLLAADSLDAKVRELLVD